MYFSDRRLQLDKPDPLWLYKVGNALIKEKAEASAKLSGDSIGLEAHAIAKNISEIIANPNAAKYETPFDSLIESVTDEFLAFDGVFKLYPAIHAEYKSSGGKLDYREFIHHKIMADVLSAYRNLALLAHLHRTGKLDDVQYYNAAYGVTETLTPYGSNGTEPMWEYWDKGSGDLLKTLQENESEITIRPHGKKSATEQRFTRKEFFAMKMDGGSPPKDEASYQKRLWEVIPQTIANDFLKARSVKEKIIARHLEAGKIHFGDDFWVKISALHPQYQRAEENAAQLDKTEYHNKDDSLSITHEELSRIRAGQEPQTLLEYLDQEFGGNNKDKARLLEHSTNKENAGDKTEWHPPQIEDQHKDKKEESGAEANDKKEEPVKHRGMITAGKVGATVLGSLLIADQMGRAGSDSTSSSKEQDDRKSEKGSKMLHYALAAAAAVGVGLVVFAKPEKLTKFVSSISEFFNKSPQR